MVCEDAVLPEPITKSHTVNCLTYRENTRKPCNENLCFFRGLASRLHGIGGLEEGTMKTFRFSTYRKLEELIQQVFKVFV